MSAGCRIGRIKPKLTLVNSSNVSLIKPEDYESVQDVIADMIDHTSKHGIKAYAIVTVDGDRAVDRHVIIRPSGAMHALLGGMTALVHDLAFEMMND